MPIDRRLLIESGYLCQRMSASLYKSLVNERYTMYSFRYRMRFSSDAVSMPFSKPVVGSIRNSKAELDMYSTDALR